MFFAHFYFPASRQAVVTGVVPSSPRFLPSIFIAHRVQESHCSSIFHRVLLTHSIALSASQFVHKKKSPRIHTSMRSGGFELTKLTYTRLEDNLIRHRGDRAYYMIPRKHGTFVPGTAVKQSVRIYKVPLRRRGDARLMVWHLSYIINIKIHSSCDEDFAETHICKLCVILPLRVLLCVSSLRISVGTSPWNYNIACTKVNRVMLVCAETVKPVLEGDKI